MDKINKINTVNDFLTKVTNTLKNPPIYLLSIGKSDFTSRAEESKEERTPTFRKREISTIPRGKGE